MKLKARVLFGKTIQEPYYSETSCLQYTTNRGWARVINLSYYWVQSRTRFFGFGKTEWAVFKFVGADTSAYGGGEVYTDRMSDWFSDELKAIQYLHDMESYDD
jgi:hypothetical protein